MTPTDPTPFVVIYVALVFVPPWVICGSFVVRSLVYAHRRGISLFSSTAPGQIRMLRQTDDRAALLDRCSRRWMVITLAAWVAGFVGLCLTLYLLHRSGIV
jgi:hypothetical protein